MPYIFAAFTLGLIVPYIISSAVSVMSTLALITIPSLVGAFTLIHAIETREKSHREKLLDDITNSIWAYINSTSQLIAEAVDLYPFKKEKLEIHAKFHRERIKKDQKIEEAKSQHREGKITLSAANEVIESRNKYVAQQSERAEAAREAVNEKSTKLRQKTVLAFNLGFEAADRIGVFGGIWKNNKKASEDFSSELRSLRKSIETAILESTDPETLVLPTQEIKRIEKALLKLREYSVLLNQREMLGENGIYSESHKLKRAGFLFSVLLASMFCGAFMAAAIR